MSYTLLNTTPIRQTDANGIVAPGALLYTYKANTTTPQATYTDATGLTPLTNPVVADATGLFPEIWLSPLAYDLVCKTSSGTLLWQSNGIAPTSTTSGYTPITVTGTDTIVGTFSPGISGYVAGQQFQFQAVGNNTTTSVTINISGLGPQPIKNPDGTNLAAGDIVSGQIVQIYYTGSFFQYVNHLQHPSGRLLNVQIFTSSGTYTPTVGTSKIIVEGVGGGSASTSLPIAPASTFQAGSAGISGAYGKALLTTGFSPSAAVVVGAAGTTSVAPTATTFGGTLFVCPPGDNVSNAYITATTSQGLAGTTPSAAANTVATTTGTLITTIPTRAGSPYAIGSSTAPIGFTLTAKGATTPFGSCPIGYGYGGDGVSNSNGGAAVSGISGGPGYLIVYEYS
jgi:hypothetical protein